MLPSLCSFLEYLIFYRVQSFPCVFYNFFFVHCQHFFVFHYNFAINYRRCPRCRREQRTLGSIQDLIICLRALAQTLLTSSLSILNQRFYLLLSNPTVLPMPKAFAPLFVAIFNTCVQAFERCPVLLLCELVKPSSSPQTCRRYLSGCQYLNQH